MAFVPAYRDAPMGRNCGVFNCRECNEAHNFCDSSNSSNSSNQENNQAPPHSRVIQTISPSRRLSLGSTGHAFQPVMSSVPAGFVPISLTSAGTVLRSSRTGKRSPRPIPKESKDKDYYERRRRNNESAKRSRELRRIKEHSTSVRVHHLELENLQLRAEVTFMRNELEKLRSICYRTRENGQLQQTR